MLDCHSHILPGVDDGSDSVKTSLEMLEVWHEIGTTTIVASSHFYPDQNLERFLQKREYAYLKLLDAMKEKGYTEENGYPRILTGAEVLLGTQTASLPDLPKLCIEGTRYILIEMPYGHWSEWVFSALYDISARHGLVPIIAHLDRYEHIRKDKAKLDRLLSMNVKIQLNAYSLVDKRGLKGYQTYRFAKKLLKNGIVDVLGSDAHDKTRIPKLQKAYEIAQDLPKELI